MRLCNRRALLVGALGVAALAGPALAHRQRAVLTTIAWRKGPTPTAPQALGRFDVVHRLHGHDAEVALRLAGGGNQPLDALEAQARVALYVEGRFGIGRSPTAPYPLTTLGAETAAREVFVYQEAVLADPPTLLAVRNVIMTEAFADQINQVNIERPQGDAALTRSLQFKPGEEWKTVSLS